MNAQAVRIYFSESNNITLLIATLVHVPRTPPLDHAKSTGIHDLVPPSAIRIQLNGDTLSIRSNLNRGFIYTLIPYPTPLHYLHLNILAG